MKKILLLVLAFLPVFFFASCGEPKVEEAKPDTEKSENVMTLAQFEAAADDQEVTIEAYIQASAYSSEYSNTSLYLQDADGGYYVYRMAVTPEQAEELVIGQKVKIKGVKTTWSGLMEIKEGTATYEILDGNWVAEALDVTNIFDNADELGKHKMEFITVSGQVEASTITNGDGEPVAYDFLYKYNGTGQKGDDLYFNIKIGNNTYAFLVETDLCSAETPVYAAGEALKAGDNITIEGFLYWYNGPQVHVTKITKK